MNKIDYSYEGKYLKNLGRYYINPQQRAKMFTFSCSGFEVYFHGTSLRAELIATECHKKDGEAAIAVVVDDQTFIDANKIVLDKPQAIYTLADNLPLGNHRVRIYKRTESSCSRTGWRRLETDGCFLPLPDDNKKHLKIEYYGDSITAGNGADGVEGDIEFETRTENALNSYAALASEKLDADFAIIAIGGFPLYRSPWNKEASIKTIPEMFSYADFDWGTYPGNAISWNNSDFIPDIVVINLGTNDDQYLLSVSKDELEKEKQAFISAYHAFIAQIMLAYPHCQIIVSIGMIKVTIAQELIEKVMETTPNNVHYLPFSSLKAGGYMPNQGHPNKAMHVYAGDELVSLIKTIIQTTTK